MEKAEVKWNLLEEPLISIRDTGGRVFKCNLPHVLSLLQANRVSAFMALQVHQRHAWHAFLVQLAAIAIHAGGDDATPVDEDRWRSRLLSLTKGKSEPWCLVVGELSTPGFMQPPVPEGEKANFGAPSHTPDEIDLLVTAKNHDVKKARIGRPSPEHWIFALVSTQTMNGFSGRGNYGIARMNGGFANRPSVALVPGPGTAGRFVREVSVLLRKRQELLDGLNYKESGGHSLLWTIPWDGTTSLALGECDPWFIEICRRFRLRENGGAIHAQMVPTVAARVEAKDAQGITGDAWTPIKIDGPCLTVSPSGFTYKLLQELLLGGTYRPGAALEIQPEDPKDMVMHAEVLVRGQGETQGFHNRAVPVPGKIRIRLASSKERESLGQMAKRRVEVAGRVQNEVLKPALCALLQGAGDRLDLKDDKAASLGRKLDTEIEDIFFECLWDDAELPAQESDDRWAERTIGVAKSILDEAIDSVPTASAKYYRSVAAAERIFAGASRNKFPNVFKGEA